MTTVIDIKEAQANLKGILANAREGDEIVIEENGEPVEEFIPTGKKAISEHPKQRILGLGSGQIRKKVPVLGLREGQGWVSKDFDEELSDSFWLGEDE